MEHDYGLRTELEEFPFSFLLPSSFRPVDYGLTADLNICNPELNLFPSHFPSPSKLC